MANYFSLLLVLRLAIWIEATGNDLSPLTAMFGGGWTVFKVKNLSYQNCGDAEDPIRIDELKMEYDEDDYPFLTAKFTLDGDIVSPTKGTLEIWDYNSEPPRKLPCVDSLIGKVGSCTHPDICAGIQWKSACPLGVPCKCPIRKGSYGVDNLKLPRLKVQLPIIIKVEMDRGYNLLLEDEAGKRLACYKTNVTYAFETKQS